MSPKSVLRLKKALLAGLLLLLLGFFTSCSFLPVAPAGTQVISSQQLLDPAGHYTSRDDLAAYIGQYQRLPANFIDKAAALELGWDSKKGNLWEVTDRLSIGGDLFLNREGLLPKKQGRIYYSCDVNYQGGLRGAERLVFSNDGLIFYSKDHYKTFVRLDQD